MTVKRTTSDYTTLPIEADNERQARRKAIKQVKKWDRDGDDIFCDNDEPRYSVSSAIPEKNSNL